MSSKTLLFINGAWLVISLIVITIFTSTMFIPVPMFNFAIIGYLGNTEYNDKKVKVYSWSIIPSIIYIIIGIISILSNTISSIAFFVLLGIVIANSFITVYFGVNDVDNDGVYQGDAMWFMTMFVGVPVMVFAGIIITINIIKSFILN